MPPDLSILCRGAVVKDRQAGRRETVIFCFRASWLESEVVTDSKIGYIDWRISSAITTSCYFFTCNGPTSSVPRTAVRRAKEFFMAEPATRRVSIARTTKETDIRLVLDLEGAGHASVRTGVGFMDHMLTLFAVHGLFDLEIVATGDTEVDDHHTVEDVGICLGMAFAQALGDKSGICRYGHAYVPMDEALARVCVDFSNRPHLHYQVQVSEGKIGTFDPPLAKEFLRAFVLHAGLTLHADLLHGENGHHILEAVFKATARAVALAVAPHPKVKGQLSSKGVL
jgi:imidazoleglycerol-phosphate dehydratase